MPQPPTPESEAEFVANAERLLRQGEPLLAYNVADTGLQRWLGHRRLRQLLALALARSGDLERANRILADLVRSGVDDAETLGVLARTHKDLGMRATDPARRAAHLESAYRLYRQAYVSSRQLGAAADAYYTGINAATVAVLRGELDEARRIASEVLVVCDNADGSPGAKAEYWSEATRGEALVILGDAAAAARHYAAAMALARGRYGDLSTTRRQARLLAAHLPVDAGWLEEVLRIPPVLVFSGHRVGRTGHEAARVPAGLESTAREAIRASLAAARPLAAYGSAAGSADILCLELVRELGGETHVVLPFPPGDFRHTIGDGDWGVRFDSLLEKADSVTVASDHRGSVATFEYADLVMTGLSALRAEMLDTDLRGLAISDGEHDGTPNGAWSVVPTWERRGIPITHVRVSGSAPARASSAAGEKPPSASTPELLPDQFLIKALLFADAVGYSRLSNEQIPYYVDGFLGAVADLNRRTHHRFEHVETAGDGLYMVFDDVEDAAHYALELSAVVGGTDWAAVGLPADFNLRIALHCGPVYCGWDPVTGSPLYTGPHASRAARIEAITPPGQVYASGAFAAVAAARGVEGIDMRYVGRIPLAKRSGTFPLHHLQPRA
jgi:tetratricopeptide (TPR) repeat protein